MFGFIGDIAKGIMGDKDEAGIWAQQRFDPYDIKTETAQRSADGQRLMNQGQAAYDAAGNRQAPQMQAAKLGAVERAQAPNLGPANQMQAATIDTAKSDQVRDVQMGNLGQLSDAAAGKGPSLAGGVLQSGQDRNSKQVMGAAAAMPGSNAALSKRNALTALAGANQQTAHDAAQMKIQETQNAQSNLVGAAANVRSQDSAIASQNATLQQDAASQNMAAKNQFGLTNAQMQMANNQFNASNANQFTLTQGQMDQGANQANLQSKLTTQGQNDAAQQYYFGAQMGMDQADRNAAMQMEQMQAQQNLGVMGLEKGAYDSAAQRKSGVAGGLISGVAGGLMSMLSDETKKKNISQLSDDDLDQVYGAGSEFGFSSDMLDKDFGKSEGLASGALADSGASHADLIKPKKDGFGDAMKMAGKGLEGGGAGGLLAGAGNNAGKGLGQAMSGSILGDVLSMNGSSPASGPMNNPTGDVVLNKDASMNVNGTIEQINKSTVTGPMNNPGAAPMGGGGGGLFGLRISDKDQKKNIESVDEEVAGDLRKLSASKWEYKDPTAPGAAFGVHVGPMAQEIEDTDRMKDIVHNTKNGKMVDYGDPRAIGTMFAGMSMLNRRLDKLEHKKKK